MEYVATPNWQMIVIYVVVIARPANVVVMVLLMTAHHHVSVLNGQLFMVTVVESVLVKPIMKVLMVSVLGIKNVGVESVRQRVVIIK
jgi:hypothetical protein